MTKKNVIIAVILVSVLAGAILSVKLWSNRRSIAGKPAVFERLFSAEGKIVSVDAVNLTISADLADTIAKETKPAVKSFSLVDGIIFAQESDRQKSEEQFRKEEEFSRRNAAAGGLNSIAPGWYDQDKIGRADLKIGDRVKVYFSGQNPPLVKKILRFRNVAKQEPLNKDGAASIEITGKVKKINNGLLVLDLCAVSLMPVKDCAEEKQIKITSSTKFYLRSVKSEKEFKAEEEAYRRKVAAGKNNPGATTAPEWYRFSAINPFDFKIGDRAIVKASASADGLIGSEIIK